MTKKSYSILDHPEYNLWNYLPWKDISNWTREENETAARISNDVKRARNPRNLWYARW